MEIHETLEDALYSMNFAQAYSFMKYFALTRPDADRNDFYYLIASFRPEVADRIMETALTEMEDEGLVKSEKKNGVKSYQKTEKFRRLEKEFKGGEINHDKQC